MAAPMSLHLLIKPKYLTSILSVVCGRTVKFQGVLPVTKSIDFKISPHIPFTASFAKKAGELTIPVQEGLAYAIGIT